MEVNTKLISDDSMHGSLSEQNKFGHAKSKMRPAAPRHAHHRSFWRRICVCVRLGRTSIPYIQIAPVFYRISSPSGTEAQKVKPEQCFYAEEIIGARGLEHNKMYERGNNSFRHQDFFGVGHKS